jgi:threonylcarbamoyladenosine tRNA methylthiotransferase MtaB
MPNQIDGHIKKERVHKLIELSNNLMTEHVKNSVGKIVRVIAEQEKDGYLVGHSRDYISLKFKGNKDSLGKEVDVKVISPDKPYNIGELV